MLREDPGLDLEVIRICIETQYGLDIASITFLPLGYDLDAFVYEAVAADGASHSLKVRRGPVNAAALEVPRALIDHGIPNIVAPRRTCTGNLWCHLDDSTNFTVTVYPFVHGDNAMESGMTGDQWQAYGATLRAMHASGLHDRFHDTLRTEAFDLPSATLVRQIQRLVENRSFESAMAQDFAAFWRERARRIEDMLARAKELGASLQTRTFETVLCHGDIHTGNILVSEDDRIWLVDWDGPLIAPRERDLLFVVGSRIARQVEPEEELRFFEGYGPIEIDPDTLAYFRYERIIEDIGEIGNSVFLDPTLSEEMRQDEIRLAMRFFAPGGDIDSAEVVRRDC